MKQIIFALLALLCHSFLFAYIDFTYHLKPIQVAQNTYVFVGKSEYFSVKNGGNIVNTAFIITDKGVVVIDTGSSHLYGTQMLEQIRELTDKPILHIFNTHHHPDHFLGNSAFEEGKIWASEYTSEYIKNSYEDYLLLLSRLILDWSKGTSVKNPTHILRSKYLQVGKHKLKILHLEGHTKSDIAIFDERTKVLFASDLVFYNRAVAMANANISQWKKSLGVLEKLPYKVLVPGHGTIVKDKKPFAQMNRYLDFLDKTMITSFAKGLTVHEILKLKKPQEFQKIEMLNEELERSIMQLQKAYQGAEYSQ